MVRMGQIGHTESNRETVETFEGELMGGTYLTVGQVARQLGISRWTLRRVVQRGDLRATQRTPGGWLRFAPAAVERYARQCGRPSPPGHTPSFSRAAPAAGTGAAAGVPPTGAVGSALLRLASLALDAGPDVEGALDAILALLADSLDAGATFLARVDGETLHVERAYDRAGMGLASGTAVPLCDSY